MPVTTTQVSVTVTLDTTSSGPPYSASNIACSITTSDGQTAVKSGWGLEEMPPPQSSGAPFTLTVVDKGWSQQNQSQVAGWDLTLLPRPMTSQASPFATNVSTLTGGADAGFSGTFVLIPRAQFVTTAGAWDWSLLVQMSVNSVIMTFDSDPEMQVDTSQK